MTTNVRAWQMAPVHALAGLALKLFLWLVPWILTLMIKFSGATSLSDVDMGVVTRYFVFQVRCGDTGQWVARHPAFLAEAGLALQQWTILAGEVPAPYFDSNLCVTAHPGIVCACRSSLFSLAQSSWAASSTRWSNGKPGATNQLTHVRSR